MAPSVLTVNGGSSSIKFALFTAGEPPRRTLAGAIERVGLADPVLTVKASEGKPAERQPIEAPDFSRAADALIGWLEKRCTSSFAAVMLPLSPMTTLLPLPAAMVSAPWPPITRSEPLPVVMLSASPSANAVEAI